MLKSLSFILGLIVISSCKTAMLEPEAESRTSALGNKNAGIEKVIKTPQGQTCSTTKIFACLRNKGGKTCLSSCDVTTKYFCEKSRLKACISAEAGEAACYAKYCDGGGEGEFMSLALLKSRGLNPNALNRLERPDDGAGYGFYDPDYMKFGTNRTLVRLQELAKRTFRKSGQLIYIGDLSNSGGGNSGRHSGHIGGKEFDLGVIGNTPAIFVGRYDHQGYDRDATRIMIREAFKMGGLRLIYFNDPVLQREFPGKVKNAGGHADHLHFYWDAD